MDPIVKPWLELWDYLDGNFWRVCRWAQSQLTADDIAWQPIPEVASVGWNLQHLAEMLDYYLARIFCCQAPVRAELPTMVSGNLDHGRWRDLDAIAAYHNQVRPAYRQFLAGLKGSDLDRVLERVGRRSISWSWAIGHIAEHESYHLGKCTLLRSMLKQRRGS
ncbi:MAG: DinB family protein [Gemmataceae bacterium]|nr:DinB family protein [Gemmataceae bacterium]